MAEQATLFRDIARKHLRLDTLEVRHRDHLDFHELSVWSIEAALRAAYEAGRAAGCRPPSPAGEPTKQ